VKHIGPNKNYKAGVWIKTNEGTYGGYWLTSAFSTGDDVELTTRQVELSGRFMQTALPAGRSIDCLFAFMDEDIDPTAPPQTSELLFANWDAILTVR